MTPPESRPRMHSSSAMPKFNACGVIESLDKLVRGRAGLVPGGGPWRDMTGGRQDGRMKRRAQPRPEAREGTAPVVGAHTAEAACQVHRLLSLAISSPSDSPSISLLEFGRLPMNFSAPSRASLARCLYASPLSPPAADGSRRHSLWKLSTLVRCTP